MGTEKNQKGLIKGLISAASEGRINSVKKYLNDGKVNVNGRNSRGCTALHWACWNGNRDIAELLLDHGADIEARSFIYATPLIWACWNGHLSITKLLLDRGCAVNSLDINIDTALHCACLWGYTECVKELLAHEADTSSTECVHDLPYGADTTILNRKRQTPLDIAKEKKHQAIIDRAVGSE